jgi:uncharacterized protein YndB with AHSA1/START domain
MLRKVLVGLAALIVVLLVVIATRPGTYRVERSTRIAAPPDVVFGLVNDFHAWDRWSPWAKLDPSMKLEIGGTSSGAGTGATYHWVGNDKVGEGKMLITDSRPGQKVDIRLEFLKPMSQIAQTEFTFRPEASGTQVNWAMSGDNNFMGKAFSLFADMDAMIGKDFEKGLAGMRSAAEAEAKRRAESATASATSTPPATPAATAPAAPAK